VSETEARSYADRARNGVKLQGSTWKTIVAAGESV
jgi:hypothetical protein